MRKRKASDPLRGLYQRSGIWWLASYAKGAKIKPISLQTRDVTEALARAAVIRNDPVLCPSGRLLGDAVDFIDEMVKTNTWTLASADSKGATLRQFCDWVGQKRADKITKGDIQDWYDGMLKEYINHHGKKHRRSTNTVNSYVSVISSFFAWLIAKKRARVNPTHGITRVKTSNTARYAFYTAEQRDALIDNCDDKELRLILYLGFHAGLRKGEISEAIPSWFDLGNGVLHLNKTPTCNFKDREERSIPITDEFLEFLRAQRKLQDPFVIQPRRPAKKGKKLLRYDPERRFKSYVALQGLKTVMGSPLTLHVMRHTFASLALQAGQSLYKVAKWMGDDERVIVAHYGHLVPGDRTINMGFRDRSANRLV